MREVVTLHFGQAGVQLGNATWELLSLEHGINEEGVLQEEPRDIECLETFYSISHKGIFVPRTMFIDLEPTVIDEVRKGSFRNLFHPNQLVSGAEDAANNFARGFFTVGKMIINTINYEFRKIMENCGNVHGIIIFRGLGGGTGSGLTSAIFDNLAEYPKTTKLEIPIYPSSTLCTSTVEPYNCLLAQHFCMEDIDLGLLFDNEAIFDVCSKILKQQTITYCMINRLMAQICSNLTVSIRFENTISSDLSVLQNNLVPYPRIHFPLCNYSPMIPESQNQFANILVSDLTKAVFDNETQLLKVDHSFGKMMSCALNYRGDISPYHVYMSLMEIKGKNMVEFVDWCPTGFKVGINLCPPVIIPGSCLVKTKRNVTLLSNTSSIGQAWQRLTHKFYMLYSKKSFVHWFIGEGMEECEFTESLYNISTLVKDYEECVLDTSTDNKENEKSDNIVESKTMNANMKTLSKPNKQIETKLNNFNGNDNDLKQNIFNQKEVTPGDCVKFEAERNSSDQKFLSEEKNVSGQNVYIIENNEIKNKYNHSDSIKPGDCIQFDIEAFKSEEYNYETELPLEKKELSQQVLEMKNDDKIEERYEDKNDENNEKEQIEREIESESQKVYKEPLEIEVTETEATKLNEINETVEEEEEDTVTGNNEEIDININEILETYNGTEDKEIENDEQIPFNDYEDEVIQNYYGSEDNEQIDQDIRDITGNDDFDVNDQNYGGVDSNEQIDEDIRDIIENDDIDVDDPYYGGVDSNEQIDINDDTDIIQIKNKEDYNHAEVVEEENIISDPNEDVNVIDEQFGEFES